LLLALPAFFGLVRLDKQTPCVEVDQVVLFPFR